MKIFGYDFEVLDDSFMEDLLQLQREGAIYTDHWFDELHDFRHIRIKLTPEETQEYARSLYALELFYRAGSPPKASDVPDIPPDIAERADSYVLQMRDGKTITPSHCPAAFMGEHLEDLLCFSVPERQVIIEELGTKNLLSTLRTAINALTPAIRLFQNREKGLTQWSITCEDDIRDLLFAILRASISDIIREEAVPSRAGTYRFVDLCSKVARLFIEIKWIDKKGSWRRIIKEINDDVQSYAQHPACHHLFFVVIDAIKDIPDPVQFEQELSGNQKINSKDISIEVFVREP
jgi:hypothetical protein